MMADLVSEHIFESPNLNGINHLVVAALDRNHLFSGFLEPVAFIDRHLVCPELQLASLTVGVLSFARGNTNFDFMGTKGLANRVLFAGVTCQLGPSWS